MIQIEHVCEACDATETITAFKGEGPVCNNRQGGWVIGSAFDYCTFCDSIVSRTAQETILSQINKIYSSFDILPAV